ncbi:MAG TPA: DUF3352 domain-containing protein [bacterium]|nr:DUF3352 domain-containing protein [bacterium]
MKRALIIVVILLIAGFAISYYVTDMFGPWATHRKTATTETGLQKAATAAPAPELLSYVPSSAALCVHLIDIAALKTAVQGSNYFKQLSSSPFWQTTVSVAEKQLEQNFKDRSLETAVEAEPPDLGLLWDLIGDEIVIAYMPGEAPDRGGTAFLAKVGNPEKLKKIVKLIKETAQNNGLTLSETKYNAETITKVVGETRHKRPLFLSEDKHGSIEGPLSLYKDKDGSIKMGVAPVVKETEVFYLCQTYGLLTGANDLAALQSIIDLVSGNKKDCLATSANYTEVASELRPGHFGECFMNLGVDWSSVFQAIVESKGAPTQSKVGAMPKMAGDSLTRFYVKDGVQFESYTALDVEKSDATVTGFYGFQPNGLPILSAVPGGSTMMTAMNCLNAKQTYELVIDSVMARNPMAAVMVTGFIAELEKKIGISITEDLLPAVGHDIAFYYKGVSFEQDIPLPEFGFVCSSSNPEKLFNAFPKIGDYLLSFDKDKALKVEHKDVAYKDNPIHVVRLAIPVGENPAEMSIAAAVVDKYFCVGFGRKQVETMIDCISHEHPLLTDQPKYKAISEGFPETVNQTAYLDFDALWQQIKSLLELYAQVSEPGKKDAFQFFDILLRPVKAVFITSLYEHPSPKTAVQRSYGHVKIEGE